MKVLEIKNNLVKIEYEAEDNLALSGFVIIEDSNNPYVAQIMNLKGDSSSNFAIVKLLFTFDEEGILKNYNGTVPTVNAKVSNLPANELLEIIPVESPIFIGNIAQQGVPLRVDKSIFENNLLICSDNLYNTTGLLDGLLAQIDEKTVVIDTEGQINSNAKIKLGADFKIPLNYETIDFIYENDLEDVDAINKAVIQDVFIEVQNYVKTLPEKFLPFNLFVNVIDSQYRETQIPELILLKNKLLKYKEMDIFAENQKEILNLSVILENNNSVVIDISDIPDNVKKEVLRYLYDVLNERNEKLYSFVKINNTNSSKKLLKRFIEKNNMFTTIICPHEFKYIEDLKEISQNIIFFTPMSLTHDFASYNTYLSKLNANEFVIYGAHTQNIPFIAEVTDLDDMAKVPETSQKKEEVVEEEESHDGFADNSFENKELTEEQPVEEDEFQQIEEEPSEDIEIFEEETNTQYIEPVEEFSETEPQIEEQVIENEPVIEEDEPITEEVFESPIIEEQEENFSAEPIIAEDNTQSEIVEEQPADVYVEPIVEPLITEEENHEQMIEQASKDVDRMFYEKIDDNEPDDDFADTSEDLTEEDLNIIEDMAEDEIPLAGELEDAIPPVEEEEQPPVVPIYPADDIEENDSPEFQPGDHVSTAKYGRGVVEKMIKYGNKMLCSINFPNIGRRLLDPAITEISKV